MKDRIKAIFNKEGELDKKILELEKIVSSETDQKLKIDSIREIVEELKQELLDNHYDALTDDLTGFVNKKAIVDIYNRRLLQSFKQNRFLSLIILDIDSLKKYNDKHGHLAGTELIKNFSIAITNSIRKSDIAARYGGDEFLIVCLNNNPESVKKIIDRLKVNISRIETVGADKASASIGFATSTENNESFEEIFVEADKRLYEAKRLRAKK